MNTGKLKKSAPLLISFSHLLLSVKWQWTPFISFSLGELVSKNPWKQRTFNIPMLNRFRSTINNLQIAPLELYGRRFAWCNDQQNPTMTKIDHFFLPRGMARNISMHRPASYGFIRLGSLSTFPSRRYLFWFLPWFPYWGILGKHTRLHGNGENGMGATGEHPERVTANACQASAHSEGTKSMEAFSVQWLETLIGYPADHIIGITKGTGKTQPYSSRNGIQENSQSKINGVCSHPKSKSKTTLSIDVD